MTIILDTPEQIAVARLLAVRSVLNEYLVDCGLADRPL